MRVFMLELANEVGIGAMHECGFSTLVAVEITTDAAMGMWCRGATASIPRQLFVAASRVNVRNVVLFQHVVHNTSSDDRALPSLDAFLQATEEASTLQTRYVDTSSGSRAQKRRANHKLYGNKDKTCQRRCRQAHRQGWRGLSHSPPCYSHRRSQRQVPEDSVRRSL